MGAHSVAPGKLDPTQARDRWQQGLHRTPLRATKRHKRASQTTLRQTPAGDEQREPHGDF